MYDVREYLRPAGVWNYALRLLYGFQYTFELKSGVSIFRSNYNLNDRCRVDDCTSLIINCPLIIVYSMCFPLHVHICAVRGGLVDGGIRVRSSLARTHKALRE